MTNAYAAFANNGNVRENTTIHEIKNKFNKTIFTHSSKAKEGVSAAGAYLLTNILADQNARSYMFGSSLNVPSKTVAVKTGTTDDNRDAWAIGYTPDITIGVWVGNNNNEMMTSGGADMAGPIWRKTMQSAIGTNSPSFTRPGGVIERNVCYGTGGLAQNRGENTYSEVFLTNALPKNSCNATSEKKEEEKPPEPEPQEQPVAPLPEPQEQPVAPLPEPQEPVDPQPNDTDEDDGVEPTDPDTPTQPSAPTVPNVP